MLHVLLKCELGVVVNRKRVYRLYRLYRLEGLAIRRRKRKQVAQGVQVTTIGINGRRRAGGYRWSNA